MVGGTGHLRSARPQAAETGNPVGQASQAADNQSGYETARFGLQNGTYCTPKRHVSERETARLAMAGKTHRFSACVLMVWHEAFSE